MKLSPWILALIALSPVAVRAQEEIPLWPKGAPGFEDRRSEAPVAKDYYIRNIHNPTITAYLPPKDRATGAAVVICPGGGHRLLVFNGEGVEPAKYLNSIGVAAFALKYRLGREEHTPYQIDKHAREDGLRAMRLVRSRAHEWGLDPKRVGVMGFSAGGEVAGMVSYSENAANTTAADPIDRENARPDFVVMIYPGPLGIPQVIPKDAPPAFLLVANDDKGASGTITRMLTGYREAGVSVEAHVFAHGGHGFNMGGRSKLASVKKWPERLAEWMDDNGILDPAKKPAPRRLL